ncbi:cation diffusion facilitator family transporter [Agrococcus sp. HG114]|uniref:cation diffusion facilitator family transporter n=1 Tax=Agrococcus sp. HG114 TaxID=2969757 RepID=UPI00215A6A8C|nr:cation diffusion facilitator family transporter [Agrococcus sp. HG114]MCR8670967.1 cation diffusion facilitator family transporter [Agrococcus sp. HG114]
MSASHGTKAVVAAFLANSGIAVTKFVAWFFSGSASMLAEAIHSVADAGNQLLLLLGGRLAKKKPTEEHPFGYGRERYVWAFIVALVLFSVGGLFSITEGISKLQHPHELDIIWLPLVVLGIAIVLESLSFRTAIKEANQVRGNARWWDFIRKAKSPELPVILLEDLAALLGLVFAFVAVGLTALTGNPLFDAIGTIVIGVLLVLVAAVLAVEMKSLLIGEGATAEDTARIAAVLNGARGVESVIHMKTLYLGPDELMIAAKVAFPPQSDIEHVATTINDLEATLRDEVAHARVIYIEPDLYIERPEIAPSTDHIVIQSGN